MRANADAVSPESQGAWFERWVRRQARDPRWGCFLVAECDGLVEGYGMTVWWSPDLVEDPPANVVPAGYYLMGTWVEPTVRRHGLGLALAQARLDWIRERADEAWYWTRRDNEASQRLHQRLGFVPFTEDFWFPPRARTDSRLYRLSWPERAGLVLDPPDPATV